MVITRGSVPLPEVFVALIVVLKVPVWVDMPEMTPVLVFRVNPVGSTPPMHSW